MGKAKTWGRRWERYPCPTCGQEVEAEILGECALAECREPVTWPRYGAPGRPPKYCSKAHAGRDRQRRHRERGGKP